MTTDNKPGHTKVQCYYDPESSSFKGPANITSGGTSGGNPAVNQVSGTTSGQNPTSVQQVASDGNILIIDGGNVFFPLH